MAGHGLNLGVCLPVHRLEDFFALWADREFLGIAGGHPYLAAQGDDGGPVDHRVGELRLGDVVRETLGVTVIEGWTSFFFDRCVGTWCHLCAHSPPVYVADPALPRTAPGPAGSGRGWHRWGFVEQ